MVTTALSVNLSRLALQENETTKRLAACAAPHGAPVPAAASIVAPRELRFIPGGGVAAEDKHDLTESRPNCIPARFSPIRY
jgi:hypothetical protein